MSHDPKDNPPQDKKPLTLAEMVARGASLRNGPEWKPSPGLIDAVADLERADELPAPDPVVLLPEKGGQVVVTMTEAAEAYVGPTVVRGALSPRLPTGPVKIREGLDPRRLPTLPSVTRAANEGGAGERSAGEAQVEAVEAATPAATRGAGAETLVEVPAAREETRSAGAMNIEPAEPGAPARATEDTSRVELEPRPHGGAAVTEETAPVPSMAAPSVKASSRRPASGGQARHRWLVALGAVLGGGLAAVLVFLWASRHDGGASATGAAASSVLATAEPKGARVAAAVTSAPPSCAAACPSAEASAAAPSAPDKDATPAADAGMAPVVTTAAGAPSIEPAPKATEDPYADAAAPPGSAKPSASAAGAASAASGAAPSRPAAGSSTPTAPPAPANPPGSDIW